MRVSVIKEDPGYIGRHITGYEVYLNGEKLDNCITADEEQGIALVFVTDERGKLVMNEERTDLVKKWVKGDIEIAAPPLRDRLKMKARGIYYGLQSIPLRIDLAWYKLRQKLRQKLKSMIEQ